MCFMRVSKFVFLQVLHEEIELPWVHQKALPELQDRRRKSLLKITRTQSTVPLNLIKVHLMVAVEGHPSRSHSRPLQPRASHLHLGLRQMPMAKGSMDSLDAVGMFQFQPLIDSWILGMH